MNLYQHFRTLCFAFIFCVAAPSYTQAQIGWQWAAGSTTTSPSGYDILSSAIDTFGNTYALGFITDGTHVFGTTTINDTTNSREAVLVKTDPSGHIAWALATRRSGVLPKAVATDPTGNVYMLGTFDSVYLRLGTAVFPAQYARQFLAKISTAGNVLWIKNVGTDGGPDNMVIDGQGNFFLTGYFYSPADSFGPGAVIHGLGAGDAYIAKFDTSFTALWANDIGSTGFDNVYTLAVSGTGSSYVTGTYWNPGITIGTSALTSPRYNTFLASYQGFFLAKFNAAGTPAWAVPLDYNSSMNGAAADANDNVYLSGYLDSLGTFDTLTVPWAGSNDGLLIAYNGAGRAKWARTASGIGGEYGISVTTGSCGKVAVCGGMPPAGMTAYTLHFGTFSLIDPPFSHDAAYCAVYDSSGVFYTATGIISGSDDYLGIQADKYGDFFVVGDYQGGSMVFGPDTLPSPGSSELLLVAKYTYDTTGCWNTPTLSLQENHMHTTGTTLYPNPAHTQLTIQSATPINEVTIANLLGQTVATPALSKGSDIATIDIAKLPAGMYLVHINGAEVRKFVKE